MSLKKRDVEQKKAITKVNTVPFIEVQEEVKLIYGKRYQHSDCLWSWGEWWGDPLGRGTKALQGEGDVLYVRLCECDC